MELEIIVNSINKIRKLLDATYLFQCHYGYWLTQKTEVCYGAPPRNKPTDAGVTAQCKASPEAATRKRRILAAVLMHVAFALCKAVYGHYIRCERPLHRLTKRECYTHLAVDSDCCLAGYKCFTCRSSSMIMNG